MAGERLVAMHFVGGVAVPVPEPQGFVYFIEAIGGKQIKIGWTDRHPVKRLANLQTGSCLPLKGLGVLIGPFALEGEMHSRFHLLRKSGEWFRVHPRLRKFVAKEARPWPTEGQLIIRPGLYSVDTYHGRAKWASRDFECERCRAMIRVGDRWFEGESKQGDTAYVCEGCVVIPGTTGMRGAVRITNLTYR